MSTGKLEGVRRLIANSKRRAGTLPNEGESTLPAVQIAYLNGLENDIKTTEGFLQKAKEHLKANEQELSGFPSESERDRKIRVLALSTTYKTIPYLPKKNDVIGIASTSKFTSDLINEQTILNLQLEKLKKNYDNDGQRLESLIADYKEMWLHLRSRIDENPDRINEINQKTDDLRNNGVSINSQISAIDEKLKESRKIEKLLSSHLKRIILKFLAFQDWSNESVMTEDELRDSVTQSVTIVDKLVSNLIERVDTQKGTWVQLEPPEMYGSLMRIMVRNELVITRENSSADEAYVRLRDYGVEF